MDIGSVADKCQSSSFITYLGQWFRGRQTREHIPVPPPNNPRHLPPPSQFVHLASATVHPNPPRCKRAIPFRPRYFSPNPPTADLVPALFQHDMTTLSRSPLQRDRFPRSNSVPAPSIAAESHLPIPPCPSPPRRVTKEPPCSGLRRSHPNHGPPPARF